jgi:hypothetical protein
MPPTFFSGRLAATALMSWVCAAGSADAFVAAYPYGSAHRTVIAVKMVCSTERVGNVTRTWSCPDGYDCTSANKCEPGAELRRKAEEEARRNKEQEDQNRAKAEANQRQTRPGQAKNCSGVSGKINGVELAPQPCADGPGKQIAVQPRAQPAPNAVAPTKPEATGRQNAIESLREVMPEFGKALDDAGRRLNSPNTPPPSQWRVTPTRDDAPPTRRPPPSQDTGPRAEPVADDAPSEASPAAENDDDDYAEKCLNESVKNGLKSMLQDIKAAKGEVVGIKRTIQFYNKKWKLIKKTLKKCVKDVMDKEVFDKLDQSGVFEEAAESGN